MDICVSLCALDTNIKLFLAVVIALIELDTNIKLLLAAVVV